MIDTVNRFYNSIEGSENQSQSALIELFVYFLTVELGQSEATALDVASCFNTCDLNVPKSLAARLSDGLRTSPPRFIKTSNGYKLHRHRREELSKKLAGEAIVAQASVTLRGLEHKIPSGPSKDFLKETIDCFEIGANRAAITMAWIMALDHMFSYILKNKLTDFNAALAQNTDKSVKVKAITQRDDFTEMKESKFIDLCRNARIISNDVRKVLEQKLDTRNSCAHPSGIAINKSKVIDFIEDLVDNVVLKFAI